MLDREEYIEQEYFFRIYRERLEENRPAQEILETIAEEVLSTTKLPMALDFLRGEIMHTGRLSEGMKRLSHYFTPFQSFIINRAESEISKFDIKIALEILEREAKFRQGQPTMGGLFIYQFECISRNRLGFLDGMQAVERDPIYNDLWRRWIRKISKLLGTIEFARLVYGSSEYHVQDLTRQGKERPVTEDSPILFGLQEGRIAKANIGKDPVYLFAALQRQLNYPGIPKLTPASELPEIPPAIEARLLKLEQQLGLLKSEVRDDLDITQFYKKPED